MPRGVPKAGFRRRKNKSKMGSLVQANVVPAFVATKETDQEINHRISERFSILSELTSAATTSDVRALIVSGPPGLGKSYTIEQLLATWDPNQHNHTIVKGYVKATGLYKLLYQYRERGKVIVFDDADSIFFDDTALNLLKAVCDTTDVRKVSYLAEGSLIDEDSAVRIPKQFVFEGAIIFITNYDFDVMIDRGHKLAPHLAALVSRAHYIDLTMKTRRDYLVRINQVVTAGLLTGRGLSDDQAKDVMSFINQNVDKLRELSLRIAIKVGDIRKSNNARWKSLAQITCCRN